MLKLKSVTSNTNDNEAVEVKQPKGFVSRAKLVGYSMVAFAATNPMSAMAANDDFDDFAGAMKDLVTGGAGKGIALIALLLGGLIGLAKSSAWPALTGLAIAAIFGLGPFLIDTVFGTFGSMQYNP